MWNANFYFVPLSWCFLPSCFCFPSFCLTRSSTSPIIRWHAKRSISAYYDIFLFVQYIFRDRTQEQEHTNNWRNSSSRSMSTFVILSGKLYFVFSQPWAARQLAQQYRTYCKFNLLKIACWTLNNCRVCYEIFPKISILFHRILSPILPNIWWIRRVQ